jgi:hypothetical protein
METKFQTQSATLNANLAELPIFKSISQSDIVTKVDTFRKGEKNLFWFIKLAVFGALGYLTWVYVLPPVFQAVGRISAMLATGIMLVAAVVMAPALLRGLRLLTRALHKTFIKFAPFDQLEAERVKMVNNQATFRISKGAISTLKSDMESQAAISEKEVKTGQSTILKLASKAEKIKADLEKMLAEKGPDIKGEDVYVDLLNELQTTLADGQRAANKLNQSVLFVSKYGTRANIMKKMVQKLSMVETQMSIKLSDFDATIEMLKKDYEFGQRANAATSAAKSAMLFSKGWEFDYALEVITSTISADIAITSGNLKDIDMLTAGFSIDSDESFENLNAIADRIKVGIEVTPTAKQYANPDYKLTSADKQNAGGFTEIF